MPREGSSFQAARHNTLKDTWHLGRQMSHLSVQAKLDSLLKPALLPLKTSKTCESSIDV
jgi:hypothetical protein